MSWTSGGKRGNNKKVREAAGEGVVGLPSGGMSIGAEDVESRVRRERRLSVCNIFLEGELTAEMGGRIDAVTVALYSWRVGVGKVW